MKVRLGQTIINVHQKVLQTCLLALHQPLQMVGYVPLSTIFINAMKGTLVLTFCLEIFPFDVLLIVCEGNTDLKKSFRGFTN